MLGQLDLPLTRVKVWKNEVKYRCSLGKNIQNYGIAVYSSWFGSYTPPRPSEISEKNKSTMTKLFLTSYLWQDAMLKVWKKILGAL